MDQAADNSKTSSARFAAANTGLAVHLIGIPGDSVEHDSFDWRRNGAVEIVRPQWGLKGRARRAALTPDRGVIGQRGFELLLYRLLSSIALG